MKKLIILSSLLLSFLASEEALAKAKKGKRVNKDLAKTIESTLEAPKFVESKILPSSAVKAKGTSGHYVGVNLINTTLEAITANDAEDNSYQPERSKISTGLSYQYAFNYKGFFVAPELFYNFNNTNSVNSIEEAPEGYELNLKQSYGVKLNLGYDITDKFSVFGLVGHSEVRAKIKYYSVQYEVFEQQSLTQEAFIMGLGARYVVGKNISVKLSHEINQLGFSKKVLDTTDKINPDYSVTSLGVAYNF